MAGLCLERAVLAALGRMCLLVKLVHLVGISVVSGDESDAVKLVNDLEYPCKLKVKRLHAALGSRIVSGMTDHVTVREVAAEVGVFSGAQGFDERVGYLCALHPRALFKGNNVGGNLDVGFKLLAELSAPVSVPEVGNVTELLGFGDGVLGDPGVGEVFAECVRDLRGIDEVVFRYVEVAVVLKHSGIYDLRISDAVEFVELLVVERF